MNNKNDFFVPKVKSLGFFLPFLYCLHLFEVTQNINRAYY